MLGAVLNYGVLCSIYAKEVSSDDNYATNFVSRATSTISPRRNMVDHKREFLTTTNFDCVRPPCHVFVLVVVLFSAVPHFLVDVSSS